MKKNMILNLLSSNSYITYNKSLAKVIGVEATIVFGELCSASNMFENEFFFLKEQIEEDTCLSSRSVRLALKTLEDYNLITITKKGIPCKNYYTINIESLEYIFEKCITSGVKSDTSSDVKNDTTSIVKSDTTINNKINNKINNNIVVHEIEKNYPKEAKELSNYLYSSCRQTDEHFERTEKQIEKWTSEFDKIHRLDKREWGEIKSVLYWTRNNKFWKSVILSASKFRDKYETLYSQMQNDKNRTVFIKNDVYNGDEW